MNSQVYRQSSKSTNTAGSDGIDETPQVMLMAPQRDCTSVHGWRLWIKKKHLFICVMLIIVMTLALGSVSVSLLKIQGTADKHKESVAGQRWREIQAYINQSGKTMEKFVHDLGKLKSEIEVQINGSESRLEQKLREEISSLEVQINGSESRLEQKLREEISSLAHKDQPKDCVAIAAAGETNDGIHKIVINGTEIPVYCEFVMGEGWLVFQRRFSGKQSFYLNWIDYKLGFGDKAEEFWLGLEILYRLTSAGSYKLRIKLESWDNETAYADYRSFAIGNSESNYQLNIDSYSGTAGDSLKRQNHRPFSTKDRDNDSWKYNCAKYHYGAWWYSNCDDSNLNGEYCVRRCSPNVYRGMKWNSWKGGDSMKTTKMKIARNDFPAN